MGVLFAAYNGFAALAAIAIPWMARRFGLRGSHLVNVSLGGLGLASIPFMPDENWLLLSMAGVGIAWASILSMPYAILSGALPARKMGVYMGVFNIFIVVPQLLAATLLGFLVTNLFGGAPVYAFVIAAVSFVLAAGATLLVKEQAS